MGITDWLKAMAGAVMLLAVYMGWVYLAWLLAGEG